MQDRQRMAASRKKLSDNQAAAAKSELAVSDKARSCNREGVPIDRGWAWVVMAAACGIYGLHGAAFKVQGVVYIEMVEHFDCDQQLALWVFSVAGLVMLTSGPVVSHIIQKTSHRTVLNLGTAAITIGIILAGYVPVMEVAFFSWGVLYGFGHCCLLMASLTCTGQYFRKYRGLAIGITAAGSGLLSFILPVVLRRLFDSLTFEGAMLMYSGISCQVFVLSTLVRPASFYLKGEEHSRGEYPMVEKGISKLDSTSEPAQQSLAGGIANVDDGSAWNDARGESNMESHCPVSAFESSDLHNAEEIKPDGRVHSQPYRDGPHERQKSGNDIAGTNGRSILHLLRDVPVVLVSITMMFFANGMNVVYTVIPPYGESASVSKETVSTLLAVGGGIEIVSRGLHGWFSDKNIVSSLLQLAFCSGVTGVASMLCPVLGGPAGIGVLSAACGFAGTSAFSLVPIVLHDLVGPESVTTALGIQMFMRGFSFILSTFVAGFVVEKTGSWDGVFYYIGINMVVSTVIAVVIYFWNRGHRGCSRQPAISSQDIPTTAAESMTIGLT